MGMRRFHCFGLKCAIFGCVLSFWGIIQLGTMGFLFQVRSIAFLDDVPEAKVETDPRNLSLFYAKVNEGYNDNAFNCWIGASIYFTIFIFSLCQCAISYLEMQNNKSKTVPSVTS